MTRSQQLDIRCGRCIKSSDACRVCQELSAERAVHFYELSVGPFQELLFVTVTRDNRKMR